jgi:ABC-type dipeptide/oligopeptide/nickel transport system permease component
VKRKILGFARQLGFLLLVVWTVVSIVTLLIEIIPGSPALAALGEDAKPEAIANFNQKHGLDKPAFFFTYSKEKGFEWHGANNRYLTYWKGVVTGDLGISFQGERPVLDRILERYAATIMLAVAALLVAVVIAIPLGVIAGTNKNTWIDNAASFFALLGISLPTFVVGPFLVYIFAVKLGWFSPTAGGNFNSVFAIDISWLKVRVNLKDLVLPAITLGAALSAILTRMVRSSVIEELGEDYVRTARAKGLSERKVVYKHVLKNGLIPVVTILGLQLGVLLAGAIITEKIFGWQGLGLLLLDEGIGKRDYRLIQGCVLVISVTYILANSLTDWVYRWLDPRIRLS